MNEMRANVAAVWIKKGPRMLSYWSWGQKTDPAWVLSGTVYGLRVWRGQKLPAVGRRVQVEPARAQELTRFLRKKIFLFYLIFFLSGLIIMPLVWLVTFGIWFVATGASSLTFRPCYLWWLAETLLFIAFVLWRRWYWALLTSQVWWIAADYPQLSPEEVIWRSQMMMHRRTGQWCRWRMSFGLCSPVKNSLIEACFYTALQQDQQRWLVVNKKG